MQINHLTYAAILISAAKAHMNMRLPTPFGNPDSSPLDPSGANYPCKLPQTDDFARTNVTTLTAGSTMPLKFKGTAVHGGGSCQISLTMDLTPTAASIFKVLYSIEGGCPQQDFDIPIPGDAPNGQYVLAWTWFNRIGNREMYMNCAPVTLGGSNGTDSSFAALPDMAIYNVASKNSCKTVEMVDVQFGNPGKYLLAQSSKMAPPAMCNGADAPTAASSSAPVAPYANTTTPTYGNSTSTSSLLQIIPVASTAPTYSYSAAAPVAATSAAVVAANADSTPATGIAAYAGLPTCPVDGAVVCSADGTQFGLCNWGYVIIQAVAAGTSCKNGLITKRSARFRY